MQILKEKKCFKCFTVLICWSQNNQINFFHLLLSTVWKFSAHTNPLPPKKKRKKSKGRNDWCFRPQLCTVRLYWAGWQPGRMRWILLWIIPLAQGRSLDLLASNPACYHCTMDAPLQRKKNALNITWLNICWVWYRLTLVVQLQFCFQFVSYFQHQNSSVFFLPML